MKSIRQLHISTRLIASILVTSVLAVVLTSLALVSYDRYYQIQHVSEDMRILANVVANRSTGALIFADTQQAEANLTAIGENPHVMMACIYDSGGAVFAWHSFTQSEQASCPVSASASSSALAIGDNMEILAPIKLDGLVVGSIYISLSLRWLNHHWQQQIKFIFMVSLLVIALAFLIARYLQRLLIKPIQEITRTARTISEQQDYSLRAEGGVGDELGDLVAVFNDMLSKVEQENHRLGASEEKFRQLSTVSPVGIFQVDLEHNIIYVNNRWSQII
ncbi:MAG: CHASE sensor domain-containing protein, partial [Bermanella sp.]